MGEPERKYMINDYKSSSQADEPPNSRLFIVGNKRLTENDFRNAFDRFGEIEDIWVVKDRRTGDNKGVTYIKYTKTSEAANALEAMNGKTLAGTDRHIKVMIASSRNKGSLREDNEDEKIQRLFIVAPKSMTENELENYFKQFGDIDYVNIVRDKETRESKGFAYIKYYKFSHAAKAFEECDRKYKAVFSEPRKPNMGRHANDMSSSMDRTSSNSFDGMFNNDKCYRLMVIASPHLTEDQLWKLFNIVPGMEYAQLRTESRRSVGSVVYTSLQWATYAVEKLHGFEYPTGSRLIVKPDGTLPKLDSSRSSGNSRLTVSDNNPSNLIQLAETIAHATTIIQNAGLTVGSSRSNAFESSDNAADLCSVRLPNPQPLANIDAVTEARCFIVCTPPPPPQGILRDIFCRFGNLIEVYLLANRNCGYAKYASMESALEAIKVLHGADVCGGRMKVIKADERSDDHSRKRQRMDDQ